MKRVVLGLVACLLAVACNSGGGSRTDGGGVMLMDSGMMMMGTDSGMTPGRDSGPPDMCMFRGMTFAPLPAEVLPRCSAETAMCWEGATTTMAQAMCLMSDTTAPFMMGGQTLNCAGCGNYQQNSCIFDSCPAETTDVICCLEAGGTQATCAAPGSATGDALGACLNPQMSAVLTCLGMRTPACFPMAAGFLPTTPRSYVARGLNAIDGRSLLDAARFAH